MGTCTGRNFGVPERKAKTGSITKYAARIQYQLQNFSIFISVNQLDYELFIRTNIS